MRRSLPSRRDERAGQAMTHAPTSNPHQIASPPKCSGRPSSRHPLDSGLRAAAKTETKDEFTPRVILPVLRSRNLKLGNRAGELYTRCIEFGVHPDARTALTTMTHDETKPGEYFTYGYLTIDAARVAYALESWCEIAICALDILALVLPKRFEQVRLHDRLAQLRMSG